MSLANDVKISSLMSLLAPLLQIWPRFHSPGLCKSFPTDTLPVSPLQNALFLLQPKHCTFVQ